MKINRKIIDYSQEELRQLQLIELEMLVEIDRICRKNNINYSLMYGTLIGAIRHKGFIPWDDDLDIGMLEKDYEKFREACKADLDTTRFFLQDFTTDPGYRWGICKLRRLDTEYIKCSHQKLKQKTGVCVDIFNFYAYPDGEKERKKYSRKMFAIRKILYSAVGKTFEKNFFKRIFFWFLSLIPTKLTHKIMYKNLMKYENANTQNIATVMLPDSNAPEGYPKVYFNDFIDVEFEGMKFRAIKNYDEFLNMSYETSYMQLPPPEKRKGVLDAIKLELLPITHEEILKSYNENNTMYLRKEKTKCIAK